MDRKRKRELESMSEHDALHEAEQQICAIANACIALQLLNNALSGLGDEAMKVMEICYGINKRLIDAHAKYGAMTH